MLKKITSATHAITAFLSFLCLGAMAQDVEMARLNINNLCAPELHGRGYFEHGDSLAADYIAGKFAEEGLLAFNNSYFQDFNFNVNTFPGEMQLKVDNEDLVQGYSFLVDPASASITGTYELAWLDSSVIFDKPRYRAFKKNIKKKVIAFDGRDFKSDKLKALLKEIVKENKFKAKAIIVVTSGKLTWSVAQEQYPFAEFIVKDSKISPSSKTVTFNVEAKLVKNYHTRNVVGYIRGSDYPNKFVAITAHYDHLGRMGRYIYFPGANDNASGIAMMLDFISHYRYHHPKYSVLFIAFAGEEAGLVGSKYFVEHPIVPLTSIRFLMNIDLMGTGVDGITVVNGTVFETESSIMGESNHFKHYVPSIEYRGKAANSDHYWFSEKGVHAQFIYMRGKYTFYHDVFDRPEVLPLDGYVGTFQLIRDLLRMVMDKHM